MAAEKKCTFVVKTKKNKLQAKEKKVRPEKQRKQVRYYPVEDVTHKKGKKAVRNPPRLRSSIKPGTVLILVATKYRGQRVVFLKQLTSGLLLVTGPYGINGVPLTRVDQAHVIATNTQLDISGVNIPDRISDKYFRNKSIKTKKEEKSKKDDLFVQEKDQTTKPPTEHIEDAKFIEQQLTPMITQEKYLKSYLKSKFALSNGVYPHQLVF